MGALVLGDGRPKRRGAAGLVVGALFGAARDMVATLKYVVVPGSRRVLFCIFCINILAVLVDRLVVRVATHGYY